MTYVLSSSPVSSMNVCWINGDSILDVQEIICVVLKALPGYSPEYLELVEIGTF